MKNLAGRTALITGGASGIGLSIARALVQRNARVAIADIDGVAAEGAAAALRACGATVMAATLDVADAAAWSRTATAVEDELGPVSIVCSNAGVGSGGKTVDQLSPEEWRWVFSINVDAHFIAAREFIPRMRNRGEGHLLQTISMAGLIETPYQGAYGASKHAAMGLARILRAELNGSGIGVTVICPGIVRTNLARSAFKARPEALAGDEVLAEAMQSVLAQGMEPDYIGERAIQAIEADEFYVLTHADWAPIVEAQANELLGSFRDSAEPGYRDDFEALAAVSTRIPGSASANGD